MVFKKDSDHANLVKQFAALEAELEQAKSGQNDLNKIIENSKVLEEKVANLEAELEQARTGQNDLKEISENRKELLKKVAILESELNQAQDGQAELKSIIENKDLELNELKTEALEKNNSKIVQENNNVDTKEFSCELCSYSNDRKWNLQRHCDKKFKSQLRCNDHETAVHKPDFEGFKCPQCPEILAFSTCLQRHIQKFHQE